MPSPARWIQLLLSLLVVATISSACKKGVPTPDGDILATLTLPTADGRAFDAGAFRGKPTIVMFASPTCGHCAKELPRAHSIAAAEGANMVAVYVSGGKEAADKAAKRGGFTGPVLVDDGKLKERYGITGVPYTLILDANGNAKTAFRGEQEESSLRDAVVAAK